MYTLSNQYLNFFSLCCYSKAEKV